MQNTHIHSHFSGLNMYVSTVVFTKTIRASILGKKGGEAKIAKY